MGQIYRIFALILLTMSLSSFILAKASTQFVARKDFQLGVEARLSNVEQRVLQMQRDLEIRADLKESETGKRVEALQAKCQDTRKLVAETSHVSDSKWPQFSSDLRMELEELENRSAKLHQALK